MQWMHFCIPLLYFSTVLHSQHLVLSFAASHSILKTQHSSKKKSLDLVFFIPLPCILHFINFMNSYGYDNRVVTIWYCDSPDFVTNLLLLICAFWVRESMQTERAVFWFAFLWLIVLNFFISLNQGYPNFFKIKFSKYFSAWHCSEGRSKCGGGP